MLIDWIGDEDIVVALILWFFGWKVEGCLFRWFVLVESRKISSTYIQASLKDDLSQEDA